MELVGTKRKKWKEIKTWNESSEATSVGCFFFIWCDASCISHLGTLSGTILSNFRNRSSPKGIATRNTFADCFSPSSIQCDCFPTRVVLPIISLSRTTVFPGQKQQQNGVNGVLLDLWWVNWAKSLFCLFPKNWHYSFHKAGLGGRTIHRTMELKMGSRPLQLWMEAIPFALPLFSLLFRREEGRSQWREEHECSTNQISRTQNKVSSSWMDMSKYGVPLFSSSAKKIIGRVCSTPCVCVPMKGIIRPALCADPAVTFCHVDALCWLAHSHSITLLLDYGYPSQCIHFDILTKSLCCVCFVSLVLHFTVCTWCPGSAPSKKWSCVKKIIWRINCHQPYTSVHKPTGTTLCPSGSS